MPEVSPRPSSDCRPDSSIIKAALTITRWSSARARTIDVTTIGARSGRAHRIEIWFYRAGDELYLTTAPAPRDWYANVLVHPRIVVYLKNGLRVDLPATGVPVTDSAQREQVLREIVDELRHPDNRGGVQGIVGAADDWIAGSPLVRIDLDDRSLSPGDRSAKR